MTDPLQEPAEPDAIEHVRAALAALDLERQRLISRLDQLQRAAVPVSAAPVPEPAKPGISNSSTAAEKIALFRRLFWAHRCRASSLGKPKDRKIWLFARLHKRVGAGRLRQAASEVRRLPQPGVHRRVGYCR